MDFTTKLELQGALERAYATSRRSGNWSKPGEVQKFTDAPVTTSGLKQLVQDGAAVQKGSAALFKPAVAGAFEGTSVSSFGTVVPAKGPGGGKGPGVPGKGPGGKGPGGPPGPIPDPGKGPGPDPGNFGYMAPPNAGGGGGGGKGKGKGKGKSKGKPKGSSKSKGKSKGSKPGKSPKTSHKPDYSNLPDVSKTFPKLPKPGFGKPPKFEEFKEVPKGKAKLPYPEPDPTDMFSMPRGRASTRGNLKNTLGRGIGSLIVGAPVGPGPVAGASVGPTVPYRG